MESSAAWLTQYERIVLGDFAASCGEGLSHKPKSEWKGAILREGPLPIPTSGSMTLRLHLCRTLSFVELPGRSRIANAMQLVLLLLATLVAAFGLLRVCDLALCLSHRSDRQGSLLE